MIVRPILFFLAILQGCAANAQTCPPTDRCVCKLHGSATTLPWRDNECNACILLNTTETNQCSSISAGTAFEREAWDWNAHQFGFWVEGNVILEDSIAVAKIKNGDVKYSHLTIRGFDTPEYQGCKSTTTGEENWAWGVENTDSPQFSDTHEENCDVNAGFVKMWFFNLQVLASDSEISSANLKVDFEFDISGVKYVTRNHKVLEDETKISGAVAYTTRGHNQIDEIGMKPFALTLDRKLFELCRDVVTAGDNNDLYEGGRATLATTPTQVVYKVRRVTGSTDTVFVHVPTACIASVGETSDNSMKTVAVSGGQAVEYVLNEDVHILEFSITQTTCQVFISDVSAFREQVVFILDMSVSQFNDGKQTAFINSLQTVYGVSAGNVQITETVVYSANAAVRRLLQGDQIKVTVVIRFSAEHTRPVVLISDILDSLRNVEIIASSPSVFPPESTTRAPSTTTQAPSTTTQAPSTTTQAPSTTTQAPSTTTQAPSTTTQAPSTTTQAIAMTPTTSPIPDDGSNTMTTQTVTLKPGLNYFSFYVFREETISNIMKTNTAWRYATLNIIDGNTYLSAQSTDVNGAWIVRPTFHRNTFVYILDATLPAGVTEQSIYFTGVLIDALNIALPVGLSFLPILYDGEIKEVLPISTRCLLEEASQCFALQYVRNDVFSLNIAGSPTPKVRLINSLGQWDGPENMLRGQAVSILMMSSESRPSGTLNRISTQLNKSDVANRIASYSTTGTATRRLLTLHESIIPAFGRHLLQESTTFPLPVRKFCPTDTSQCVCTLENQAMLKWPVADCNSCVNAQGLECEEMGKAYFLLSIPITFNIHVVPPSGIQVTELSTAVAKLKNSVDYVEGESSGGVPFPHLSIRAYNHAECKGCVIDSQKVWDYLQCAQCPADKKLFLFQLPIISTTNERAASGLGLVLNFEFEIEDEIYVTANFDYLKQFQLLRNDGSTTPFPVHNVFETLSYDIVRKAFQIVCPGNQDLLSGGPICPFEGTIPAEIDFTTRHPSSSQTATGKISIEGFGGVMAATGMIVRQIGGSGTDTNNDAPPRWMSYKISGMPNGNVFVTVKRATFSKCMYEGQFKFQAVTNGLDNSCDAALIANGTAKWFTGTICSRGLYKPGFERRLQSDRLSISRFSDNVVVDTPDVYDQTREITSSQDWKIYELSPGQSLEVDLLVDAYECAEGAQTGVQISITEFAPIQDNADTGSAETHSRLLAYDASVEVCETTLFPLSETCACMIPNTFTLGPWPYDECNACVNGGQEVCSGMGRTFISIKRIAYNFFITNLAVKDSSLAVAKLKHSREYLAGNPAASGVQFEHLSVRSLESSVCVGCFVDANKDRDTAEWGEIACNNCPSDDLRIYFFTLTLRTTGKLGGEIADDGDNANALPVHFEFWIDGKFYVTNTVQSLQSVLISAAGQNEIWSTEHYQYQTPLVDNPGNNVVVWPQMITVDLKLFEIVCELTDEFDCPYEGLAPSILKFLSKTSENDREFKYTIRKSASNDVQVSLIHFHLAPCGKAAVYDFLDGNLICDPACVDFDSDGNTIEPPASCGDYRYEDYSCAELTYSTAAGPQEDKLSVYHYKHSTGRVPSFMSPNQQYVDQQWSLSADDDMLEIVFKTDGSRCSDNDFRIEFEISTTPSATNDNSAVATSTTIAVNPTTTTNAATTTTTAAAPTTTTTTAAAPTTTTTNTAAPTTTTTTAPVETSPIPAVQCAVGSAGSPNCVLCNNNTASLGLLQAQCSVCGQNHKNSDNFGICISCGEFSTRFTTEPECLCNAGYYRSTDQSGVSCKICSSGTWRSGRSNDACEVCPANSVVDSATPPISRDQCICDATSGYSKVNTGNTFECTQTTTTVELIFVIDVVPGDFDTTKQNEFKETLAESFGTTAENIVISNANELGIAMIPVIRRRLLQQDSTTESTVYVAVTLFASKYVQTMQKGSVDNLLARMNIIATVSEGPPPTGTATESSDLSLILISVGAAVAIVGIIAIVLVRMYCRSPNNLAANSTLRSNIGIRGVDGETFNVYTSFEPKYCECSDRK